jgi:hypothetical protein
MEENNGWPREEEEEGDGLFSSITDNADSNETLGSRANSDQEYQYVLETGEVPRDEYDAYDPADQNTGHLRISQLRYYAILWIFSRYHFVILLNCCHFDIH